MRGDFVKTIIITAAIAIESKKKTWNCINVSGSIWLLLCKYNNAFN